MSEKLDGYRAIYYNDSNGGGFISRSNLPFNAPVDYLQNISQRLPKDIVLDGELYTKKGDFVGMGVVRKKIPVPKEWAKVTYIVFDLPMVNKPYRERYQILKKLIKDIPNVKLLDQIEITSSGQLEKFHKNVVKNDGEGSIIRNPDSYYKGTRTRDLLKVKDILDDEVIVVDMEYGDGKNSSVMGHLIVKWAPGAKKSYKGTFSVGGGFTDLERSNWKSLFKPGTIITIQYMTLSPSGKPREPRFFRIRQKE
jgi:DNA ligase-1